jgi:AsmA-like C-terminal region
MLKKAAIAVSGVLVLGAVAAAVLARTVLTGDNVRAAVAAQLSAAIGQPVAIGALSASIYPRVTMTLNDVAIGEPATIRLRDVRLGTDLRALISRRIERADVRVDGARIELPLPALAIGRSGASTGDAPVEIVSIDEIVLTGVEVARGDRVLRGDVAIVPQGSGVELRRVSLAADDTSIEMTGTLTSLTPLDGRIEASTPAVNLDRLLAFLSDFAGSSATVSSSAPRMGGRLTFVVTAGQATTGTLTLNDLKTTAVITPGSVALDPASFGVFGGRYEGTIEVALGETPRFRWRAKVAGLDTPALMAFAGSPNTITGTLAGSVQLESAGLEMHQALRAARGSARIDIADGSIAGLSLVRTVVLATSGRGGYATSAVSAVDAGGQKAEAERFSRLGATLALAGGIISTRDFAMTSTDLDLNGAGTLQLATMTANLKGQVRLSEALSQKGGTDLYRYTQEGGRVTLPATVSGPLANLSVRIDVAGAAGRALRNRANEEIQKAIERNLPGGLGGLFKKPPR